VLEMEMGCGKLMQFQSRPWWAGREPLTNVGSLPFCTLITRSEQEGVGSFLAMRRSRRLEGVYLFWWWAVAAL
jgi:hypothetical protein